MFLKKSFSHFSTAFRMAWDVMIKIKVLLFDSWICGVKFGIGCKFYGSPYFSQSTNGRIEIGNNCTFRSRETSNMIGLNHRCMVSTSDAAGNHPIIKIGNNCGFSGVSIRCFKSIAIGDNVRIGANSLIIDGDSHFNDPRTSVPESIIIEDNVFVGADCIIRKGVTIGKNSVIGMRSMVLHDIPANCVAVGSPAKVIKEIGA